MRIVADCVPTAGLESFETAALRELLERHFSGVTQRGFADDLADKSHVVRLFDGAQLVGFSTLSYSFVSWQGRRLAIIRSGDTIVDPSAWSAVGLAPAWIAAVRALHDQRPEPLYWLLICSSVRTYRFLEVFWQHFIPSVSGPDLELESLRDHLAQAMYGAEFHPSDGVVRLIRPQVLRPHLQDFPDHVRHSPGAQLFYSLNPGHADGDELVCLCALSDANLTAAGRRMVRMQQRL